ncbi:MAG: hypothetical protein K8T25_03050 [Planctomycetia bacterium]|nr:hypothetical protein [Planctomycetia bacterium]
MKNVLAVKCIEIGERERDAYLNEGYNNPPANSDQEAFIQEWQEVYSEVEKVVSNRWLHSAGDGDFCMHDDWAPTRLLCIEIENERMLGRELVNLVHNAISSFQVDYSVDICDAWGYLKTAAGEEHPHFNIFVEKKRILVYTESRSLLAQLVDQP